MEELNNDSQADFKAQTICQIVIAVVCAGAALYWLRGVLLPFVLAVFLVCGVAPVLEYIERRLRAPRSVAVVITFLLGVAGLALVWVLIWISIASLLNDADMYRQRFYQLVSYIPNWVKDPGEKNQPNKENETSNQTPSNQTPADQPPQAGVHKTELSAFMDQQFRTALGKLSGSLMEILSTAVMVLIFMLFLLLGDTSKAARQHAMWNEIQSNIREYIVTKTTISVFTGAIYGLVLWLFGIPLALVFGLLAFLLNFIPNIGPILVNLLPLPLIILHPDLSIAAMVCVILLSVAVQFISGNIVEPKIMGDSFELHPVTILLALMFWGMIWGIVGMVLATPITSATKILLEKFDRTRPIAHILAGRFDTLPV